MRNSSYSHKATEHIYHVVIAEKNLKGGSYQLKHCRKKEKLQFCYYVYKF